MENKAISNTITGTRQIKAFNNRCRKGGCGVSMFEGNPDAEGVKSWPLDKFPLWAQGLVNPHPWLLSRTYKRKFRDHYRYGVIDCDGNATEMC